MKRIALLIILTSLSGKLYAEKEVSIFPAVNLLLTEEVVVLKHAVGVAASTSHSCAIIDDGTIKCWGRNDYSIAAGTCDDCGIPNERIDSFGALGNSKRFDSLLPVLVTGIDNAVEIHTGRRNSCALLDDGLVKCWGINNGSFGSLRLQFSSVPVTVSDVSHAVKLSTDGDTFCAILESRALKCWGLMFARLDAFGGGSGGTFLPKLIDGLNNVIDISLNRVHHCATISGGSIKCWGKNGSGQLGNGTTDSSLSLTDVVGVTNALKTASGNAHTCALLENGSVSCWGNNREGQLGNGTRENSLIPVQVLGVSTAIDISADRTRTCALLSGGTVKCWGEFSSNQGCGISNGVRGCLNLENVEPTSIPEGYRRGDTDIPVTVPRLSGVQSISVSSFKTCAQLLDGTVKCWGLNGHGSLGNQQILNALLPVHVTENPTN